MKAAQAWVWLALFAWGSAQAAPPEEAWRIATVELPPAITARAPDGGYYAVLLRRVFAQMQQPVRFEFLPPQRALVEMGSGRAVAGFPFKPTPQRERELLFSEPFYIARTRLFLRADDRLEPRSLNDLKGQIGCNLHGALAPEALQRAYDEGQVGLQRVATLEACFRMLAAGRVRFVATGENIGKGASRNVSGDSFRMADWLLAEEPVRLAFSRQLPGSSERVARFNAALVQLKLLPAATASAPVRESRPSPAKAR